MSNQVEAELCRKKIWRRANGNNPRSDSFLSRNRRYSSRAGPRLGSNWSEPCLVISMDYNGSRYKTWGNSKWQMPITATYVVVLSQASFYLYSRCTQAYPTNAIPNTSLWHTEQILYRHFTICTIVWVSIATTGNVWKSIMDADGFPTSSSLTIRVTCSLCVYTCSDDYGSFTVYVLRVMVVYSRFREIHWMDCATTQRIDTNTRNWQIFFPQSNPLYGISQLLADSL